MERFKVYKVKKGLAYFLIIFGGVLLLLGIALLIKTILGGTSVDWNSVIFILQGSLFIIMGYLNLRSDKYYIEWDENKLNYFLPKSNSIETVTISEIKDVSINLFEIHLKLEDTEKIIHLDNLQFKEIRRIKEKFEQIKSSTEENLTNI